MTNLNTRPVTYLREHALSNAVQFEIPFHILSFKIDADSVALSFGTRWKTMIAVKSNEYIPMYNSCDSS